MSEQLKVEVSDHILTITLTRPEKYNAMSVDMYYRLAEALYRLDTDPDLRVGILQAEGKHFTAGLELDQWAPIFAQGKMPELSEGQLDPFGVSPEKLTKPMIIAVQGICYTAGLEILLNTDIRLAAPGTRFAQLEVKRGIFPCGGGTVRLPQEIGWGNAQRYLMTGDEFTAEQAERWGMIQELVPVENLHDRARELALSITKAAPLGVQASLRSSKLARNQGHAIALEKVFQDMPAVLESEDAKEGVQSFLERREANFQGK